MGRRKKGGVAPQSKVGQLFPGAKSLVATKAEEVLKEKYPGLVVKPYQQVAYEDERRRFAETLRADQAAAYDRQQALKNAPPATPSIPSSKSTRAQTAEGARTAASWLFGGRKTLRSKFDRCVKSVKKTVKARKGSSKESAAIGICTKSVLHPRGRTIKRYRKGRLITQKKFRGGRETF